MQCGCPVITSSTSSLPEVGGDAALYVDPRNPDSMRTALEQIVNDAGLHSELRAKGLTRARVFSWEKTAAMTLEVYDEVVQ